ncbi:MAG: NifU family protein [Bacteroidota bacterium]|nr:NifU family protein [Bacteroidota bacterium]MDP3146560.1 NifU family protein [Bacteroidota bacterium]MDP3556778.1 NifU family protein [Bacteroidota bacterium]
MNLQEIPYIIYVEETPNPSSVKFVANKLLLVSGATAEYKNASETADAPIAQKIFQFPFVKSIFIASNFITITKHDEVIWEEVRDEIRVFITDYLNKGNAIINKLPEKLVPKDSSFKETISINTQHVPPSNDVENKIIEILEQYIRPAVESDGGLITFKELKDGIVTVQMRGSCSGCPSSTLTLKAGIEALLKRLLPDDVKEVVSEAL